MNDLAIDGLGGAGKPQARNAPPKQDLGDLQTFLKMLTTQMQNQDPLEPMKSSDFAAQLASFSSVEQQVQTNSLLEALSARMGLADLGSWLGREVLTSAPVAYRDMPIDVLLPDLPGAETTMLVARNPSGEVVGRFPVSQGAAELRFDMGAYPEQLQPGGLFSFSLAGYRGEELVAEAPVSSYGVVREALLDKGSVQIVLDHGERLGLDMVEGIRTPAPADASASYRP